MVKTSPITSVDLAQAAVKGMQELKGQKIVTIDMRKLPNSVCDFFVICHGTSDTQVEALGRSIERVVYEELGDEPNHKEGTQKAEWLLLDYFNVVIHVFKEEARNFYNIEGLWADGEVTSIED